MLICRLPLLALCPRLETFYLGDLLRLLVRPSRKMTFCSVRSIFKEDGKGRGTERKDAPSFKEFHQGQRINLICLTSRGGGLGRARRIAPSLPTHPPFLLLSRADVSAPAFPSRLELPLRHRYIFFIPIGRSQSQKGLPPPTPLSPPTR